MKRLLLLVLVLLGSNAVAAAKIEVETLASGLGVPWGMTFIDDSRLLITERGGEAWLLEMESGVLRSVQGLPKVVPRGQGGLLDVQVSPSFPQDSLVYFTYSKPVKGGVATALGRARLSGFSLDDWQDLFVSNVVSNSAHHFGSRICFDKKGHLFLSHGDRGDRDSAQDLSNHGGAILRLNLGGSIPKDNPFVGMKGAQPEIWSYGHRNPQGLVCDVANNRLWTIEHGPRGGDELNLVKPGKNYGWPVISYGKEYALPIMVGEGTHRDGMEQPENVYVPSIAPSSLMLYSGKAFPSWRGNLFAGALALRHLNRIILDAEGSMIGEERLLRDRGERIRNIIEAPGGELVLSTDSGDILLLKPGGQ